MPGWDILYDLLIVLGAALVLGTVAEQFRQSAILGYLLAGTLVGPNVFGFVTERENVETIAELGVAMLLFSIGLEFSFRRLRQLGRVALVGGSAQVIATAVIAALAGALCGLGFKAAVAVGGIVAFSSTACVLRLLVDRGAMDSMYGRSAMGMLLLQDVAVIPALMIVVVLTAGGTFAEMTATVGLTLLQAAGLVIAFVVIFHWLVPRVLNLRRLTANRELPIVLAVVLAMGSAYAAHAANLSPAIGAFVAGVLLGGSPFAMQVRADIGSLRTLLVTVFFASIGMLGDPVWIADNWLSVIAIVVVIIAGKALIVWVVIRSLGYTHGIAAATGLCLAQVGEFSFVLAETAVRGDPPLIGDNTFRLMVSATIATLFFTPFLVAAAPRVASYVESVRRRKVGDIARAPAEEPEETGDVRRNIMIIGFGPAGQAVATALYGKYRDRITVVELSPKTARIAQQLDLPVQLGDGRYHEVLEYAGIGAARVIAITVPNPDDTRTIIQLCRHLAPKAAIVARSRYHVRRWELALAGAIEVIDEEEQVGLRIAASARRFISASEGESET